MGSGWSVSRTGGRGSDYRVEGVGEIVIARDTALLFQGSCHIIGSIDGFIPRAH